MNNFKRYLILVFIIFYISNISAQNNKKIYDWERTDKYIEPNYREYFQVNYSKGQELVNLFQTKKYTNYSNDKIVEVSSGSPEAYTELIYTVRRGDTLWDIANDFGVSLAALARDNGLKNPSRIWPGKKLKIKMSRKL